ncbi:hypothetical protein [Anaerotignum sp.]
MLLKFLGFQDKEGVESKDEKNNGNFFEKNSPVDFHKKDQGRQWRFGADIWKNQDLSTYLKLSP